MRLLMTAMVLLTSIAAVAQEKQPVITRLDHVTVFVKDYDEALKWYTATLGLEKTADQAFGNNERWLTVAPHGQKDGQIVLAKPKGANTELIGKQALWVFHTDDCQKAYETLKSRGVKFRTPPQKLSWGAQAIFEDLYGNEFVLLGGR